MTAKIFANINSNLDNELDNDLEPNDVERSASDLGDNQAESPLY